MVRTGPGGGLGCHYWRMRMTIAAKPEPFTFDPAETAVIAVDLQNDFGAEGGYVHHFGVPLEGARATIEPIGRVLAAARAAGMPVVYTKVEYKRDLSNLGAPESPTRKRLGL